MSVELQSLIELAQKYEMSSDEREAQVRSFAYGNTHYENESITKEDIDTAADSLKREDCEPADT